MINLYDELSFEQAKQVAAAIVKEFERRELDPDLCFLSVGILFESFLTLHIKKGRVSMKDIKEFLWSIYKDLKLEVPLNKT